MNKFARVTLALFLLVAAAPFVFFGTVGWFCYRSTPYGRVMGMRLIGWVTA